MFLVLTHLGCFAAGVAATLWIQREYRIAKKELVKE